VESARHVSATDDAVKALLELAAACHIALDALPRLGEETETFLRPHIETLCERTDHELHNRGVFGDAAPTSKRRSDGEPSPGR
jgi:hypothetical protein